MDEVNKHRFFFTQAFNFRYQKGELNAVQLLKSVSYSYMPSVKGLDLEVPDSEEETVELESITSFNL